MRLPDRDRLLQAFVAGSLLRPDPTYMNVVDVIRGVARTCGADIPLNDHSRAIAGHLREARHVILVLADGLGVGTVDRLARSTWLRRRMLRAIRAPFPTTTPVAITSLATGEYPAQHAILGWWTHLPVIDAPVTVFAHERATDSRSLGQLNVGTHVLFPAQPLFPQCTRDMALIMPVGIIDSVFTRWMSGAAPRIGYHKQGEMVAATVERVRRAEQPTFTYLYTPVPDTIAHEAGIDSRAAAEAIDTLDANLDELEESLAGIRGGVRIIVVADHGHLTIDDSARLEVADGDSICSLLSAPPAGDLRTQYWHVKPDAHEAFESAFQTRFGAHFLLLRASTVEELGLLGPSPWSDETRARFGDYLSIARGSAALRYAGFSGRDGFLRMRSSHSGLTPTEIEVPLIVGGSGFAR
ncbi:MAG: hypothetical protein EXR68_01225 [Dehalococcoidia bacterium]|nr:hypothetical protein [Dehalococcoidia bacterium]